MNRIRTIKTRHGWRLERSTAGRIECRSYSHAELARLGIVSCTADPNGTYLANAAYTCAEYAWDCGYPSKQQWKELA